VPEGAPPGDFDLFTLEPEGWRWRYRFSDEAPSAECFRRYWLESFYQPGMRSLVVTARGEDGELRYLHDVKLRRHGPQGKRTENVRTDLERAVAMTFGIDPRVTRAAAEALRALRAKERGR
jgi:hypothetical protein